MRFDATTPNVFQAAMFWMHSAHGHKNGYKPTPVREKPDYVEQPLRYCHQAVPHARAALYLSACT